jgi:hypothetical protein
MRIAALAVLGIGILVLIGTVLLPGQAQVITRDGQFIPAGSTSRYGSWRASTPGNPTVAQANAPDAAVVRRSRDTRILDELSRVERRLEVIDDGPAPFWGGTPGGRDPQRELQALTQQAQAVVVGQIVAIHSSLSADQTWLESTVDLRIDDVLKATPHSTPVPGQVLTLRLYGGKLQSGEKEVIAKRSWAALPEEGRQYLYFLVALDDGSFLPFPETAIFEQTDSGLRRLGGEGVDLNEEPMAQVTVQSATEIPVGG